MTRSKKKKNSPGSSDIHTDGICVPDPANPSVLLTFVGTWSEHDPSWEVRTLPKIPTDLLYPPPPPPTVALEIDHSSILVAYIPMLICRSRAGAITLTRGACRFQLAPGLPRR
jgi:hypothetical protein